MKTNPHGLRGESTDKVTVTYPHGRWVFRVWTTNLAPMPAHKFLDQIRGEMTRFQQMLDKEYAGHEEFEDPIVIQILPREDLIEIRLGKRIKGEGGSEESAGGA